MLLGRDPLTLKEVSNFKACRSKDNPVVRLYSRQAAMSTQHLPVLHDGTSVLHCVLQSMCVAALQHAATHHCVLQSMCVAALQHAATHHCVWQSMCVAA